MCFQQVADFCGRGKAKATIKNWVVAVSGTLQTIGRWVVDTNTPNVLYQDFAVGGVLFEGTQIIWGCKGKPQRTHIFAGPPQRAPGEVSHRALARPWRGRRVTLLKSQPLCNQLLSSGSIQVHISFREVRSITLVKGWFLCMTI